MENYINTSTIQHMTAIVVYALMIVYTIAKKKEIHRTTRRSTAEFILVMIVLWMLVLANRSSWVRRCWVCSSSQSELDI